METLHKEKIELIKLSATIILRLFADIEAVFAYNYHQLARGAHGTGDDWQRSNPCLHTLNAGHNAIHLCSLCGLLPARGMGAIIPTHSRPHVG